MPDRALRYADKLPLGRAVATDAVNADIVTYTVPAGKTARLKHAWRYDRSGAPTTQLQIVRSANIHIVRQDAAAWREVLDMRLEDGDTARIRVTTAGAAGANADGGLSLEELVT